MATLEEASPGESALSWSVPVVFRSTQDNQRPTVIDVAGAALERLCAFEQSIAEAGDGKRYR